MPTTLEIQGAVKLRKLAQLYLPRQLSSRVLLDIFPFVKDPSTKLVYERDQQYTGLQGAVGLGGRATPVNKRGFDQWVVEPGYYRDAWTIDEEELTNLRDTGKWDEFKNYDKQAASGTEHLVQRFLDRAEVSISQLIMTGSFTAADKAGVIKDRQVFNVPQYTPSTLFSDLTNSQPLNYIRDLIPSLELGKSVRFQKGYMLMSRPTLNLILKNQNATDLNGRRLTYGQTVNSEKELNELFVSNDLPPAKVYDEGYYPGPAGPAANFTRFLTNGKIVMVGVRTDGEQLGEYRLTRCAQNGENAGPGEWYQVEDRRTRDPVSVILRAGHAGGPVPYYTEGFAVINAAAPF